MTPALLSSILNRNAESVCKHLLPKGKRKGSEWVCGDLSGDEGESLKIAIEGDKTGVGSDFATGQGFGDLLDVWCAVQSVGLAEAMAQACSYLGIVDDSKSSRPSKDYAKPNRPHTVKRLSVEGKVYAYLKLRGLTDSCLEDFRIAEDGDWMVFPSLRNGELVNIKYIHIDRIDGKKQVRQEKGAEPCLFGWQALDLRFPTSRYVCLTEGQIDAATLHQCGLPALSVPNDGGGGGKQDWIETEYDRRSRFDTLYLCLDNDEAGQQATKEIIHRMGPERCRIVTLPFKDANECFANGIRNFQRYLLSSKVLDPEELKPADTFHDPVMDKFYPTPGSYVGMKPPFKKLGQNLIFRKPELIIWTGWTSCGKSTMLNQVMVQGLADGEKFACASLEMPSKVTLWGMVRQMTGEQYPSRERVTQSMKWLRDKLWMIDILKTANPEKILSIFQYAYRRYGITNFILDSLLKCGVDEKDIEAQKNFVNQLIDFVNITNSTIHLVAHMRKGEDMYKPGGLSDVRGGAAITDLAHTVISVWRNRVEGDEVPSYKKKKVDQNNLPPEYDTLLKVEKQRETGWEGKAFLSFDTGSLQFREERNSISIDYLNQVKSVREVESTF